MKLSTLIVAIAVSFVAISSAFAADLSALPQAKEAGYVKEFSFTQPYGCERDDFVESALLLAGVEAYDRGGCSSIMKPRGGKLAVYGCFPVKTIFGGKTCSRVLFAFGPYLGRQTATNPAIVRKIFVESKGLKFGIFIEAEHAKNRCTYSINDGTTPKLLFCDK